MIIKKIEFFSKNLLLTKPYTIAYKTITDVENVFLLVTLEMGLWVLVQRILIYKL